MTREQYEAINKCLTEYEHKRVRVILESGRKYEGILEFYVLCSNGMGNYGVKVNGDIITFNIYQIKKIALVSDEQIRRTIKKETFENCKSSGYVEEEYHISIHGKVLTYRKYKEYEQCLLYFYKQSDFKGFDVRRYFTINMNKIIVNTWVETY